MTNNCKLIFDNINMEIDFTLDDILDHFNVDSFKFANGNLVTEAELMAQIIHRDKVESK